MALIDQTECGYLRKHYEVLKHAVILDVAINAIADEYDPHYIEYWPSLKVRLRDGQTLWVDVDCDPEGNGPGHLSGWRVK